MSLIPVEIPQGLTIPQGADWSQTFKLYNADGTVYDLSDYTSAKLQARENITDSTAYLTLQTSDGSIVLGGASGVITLSLNYATTAALTVEQGFFDLYLYKTTANADRICYGTLYLTKQVTL